MMRKQHSEKSLPQLIVQITQQSLGSILTQMITSDEALRRELVTGMIQVQQAWRRWMALLHHLVGEYAKA